MPRTKKATPAKPPPGEVIQFADLKRKRDVCRADKVVRVHIIRGEAELDGIALCFLEQGGYTFGRVTENCGEVNGEKKWRVNSAYELKSIYGRVVLIEDPEEGGAA